MQVETYCDIPLTRLRAALEEEFELMSMPTHQQELIFKLYTIPLIIEGFNEICMRDTMRPTVDLIEWLKEQKDARTSGVAKDSLKSIKEALNANVKIRR